MDFISSLNITMLTVSLLVVKLATLYSLDVFISSLIVLLTMRVTPSLCTFKKKISLLLLHIMLVTIDEVQEIIVIYLDQCSTTFVGMVQIVSYKLNSVIKGSQYIVALGKPICSD